MAEKFYESMNLYDDCKVYSTIFKKAFYDNADITKADKDILKDDVEKIILKYSLKEENINVSPYKDEEIEYDEIEIIQVNVLDEGKYKKICELIQKAIPYPLILVVKSDNKILINTAYKRINKNDEEKNTIEQFIYTDWIDLNNINENQMKFLQSVNMKNLSFANMYKLYCSFVEKINILNASMLSGDFNSLKNKDIEVINKLNDEVNHIDDEINKLRMLIKKESQFNKKMDMNMKIKKLEIKRKDLIEELKS
ncbi:DUF4391 domain-containing protein [Clostridium butyricum]|uniref:DUF4391 domain-containing protein n=1 Tax=Clostridium butyricum TaxID=1492 RepID=UPI002ABE75D4|nr:DUF4391 domain-containing protein [Clostridium butyricum]